MIGNRQLSGMRGFTLVWLGQLVSLTGTSMSRFALTIWAWQITGEATALALVGFFSFMPMILFSPFAGALVDRWNRKLVMMLSDLAAGVATIAVLLLYLSGNLQIWHLYITSAFTGIFEAFQWPAYSATISTMVPKAQYGRANGMMSLAQSASSIAAPVIAAAMLEFGGIQSVLMIDIISFVFAVATLLIVFIPQPTRTTEGDAGRGSLLKESLYGFRYISERPNLLALQLYFFVLNLFGTGAFVLLSPYVLARTNNDSGALAAVEAMLGVGGVIGGLLLTVWGGPKRRIHGLFLGLVFSSILGVMPLGMGQSLLIWMAAALFTTVFMSFINAANQAIWQAKVAPDVQGRVFAVRRVIAQIPAAVVLLGIGPLVDNIFEPGMMPDGALASIFGGLVGVGPGAGMGLLITIMGVLGVIQGVLGYAIPVVRDAESRLPDFVMSEAEPSAAAA